MRMLGWSAALRASGLPEGSGRLVQLRGEWVALYRVGGKLHALGARCPHEGSLLSEAAVGEVAICPSHGWTFRLEDGQGMLFRTSRVPVFATRVVDGVIWVKINFLWACLADVLADLRRIVRPKG
jgi:nitrite reductase/ring-hydroxylating ferredoxin subunit